MREETADHDTRQADERGRTHDLAGLAARRTFNLGRPHRWMPAPPRAAAAWLDVVRIGSSGAAQP
jgi:hypothetical protein